MKKIPTFAGIGPRETPASVCNDMAAMGNLFAKLGWYGCSGFGEGADQAWLSQIPQQQQEVWLPWSTYNGASMTRDPHKRFRLLVPTGRIEQVAKTFYANDWGKATQGIRLLMMRNVAIMMSNTLDAPVDLVAYWQSEAKEHDPFGGTNHAIKVAKHFGIPCFNIRKQEDVDAMSVFVESLTK